MTLHIGIVAARLFSHLGGTERFGVTLAQAMHERGHRVTLFGEKTGSETPVYPVNPGIRLRSVLYNDHHRHIRRLREELRASNMDVCVVHTMHLFWSVALLGSGVPFLYSENSCPGYHYWNWSKAGRAAALSGADAIHLLLPEYADSIPDFLRDRVTVIPNAAPAPPENGGSGQEHGDSGQEAGTARAVCFLGRFAPVKQLDLLIEAFASLHPRFPDWELHLWGDGPEEERLRHLAGRSGAAAAIRFKGPTDAPLEALRKSAFLALPSRFEGLPYTLLESMTAGIPAAGFADCPGVSSLIEHEKNGLLAPSMTAASLADALARLMHDDALRAKLAAGCRESLAAYQPGPVFDAWERLLVETAARKGQTRMDAFAEEPFASTARLSAAARREYLFRDFGEPFPGTPRWLAQKALKALGRGGGRLLETARLFSRRK